jgi:arylsulfatase A-like enzyme
MIHRIFRIISILAALVPQAFMDADETRPYNVLFIICDDLNDFIEGLGGQEGHPQAFTPNLETLAESSTVFPMAYSNNPVCAPSRSSLLYGMFHQTSGSYFWEEWYDQSAKAQNSYTMNRFFKENGYRVIGSGKVNHHMWKGYRSRNSDEFRRERDLEWSQYEHLTDYGPFWGTSGSNFHAMPDVPAPFREIGSIDGSYGSMKSAWESPRRTSSEKFFYGGAPWWGAPFRYNSEDDRDPTPDEKNAAWAVNQLQQLENADEPFFLAVGFVRPHTPLHAPQKYFDLYPLEPGGVVDQVVLTRLQENDIADTHMHDLVPMGNANRNKGPRYYQTLLESYDDDMVQALRVYTQAYLACVAAVDDAIGTVITALDNSPLKDNTIVVVTSDHGYNLGEKEWLFKGSPWEESCRVPLLIRVPEVTIPGSKVEVPVSLIDLYPTLIDFCDLPKDNRMNESGAYLDGYSLRALIEDPTGNTWTGHEAALTMLHNQSGNAQLNSHHFSIRTQHYRYIRYSNGDEELYDHRTDPDEWNNLADTNIEVAEQHSALLDEMFVDIADNRNRFMDILEGQDPDYDLSYHDGIVSIKWNAMAGAEYRVFRSSDLVSWDSATTEPLNGSDQITFSEAQSDEHVYYRIVPSLP